MIDMAMGQTAKRLKEDFEKAWPKGTLTYRQMWFIIKVAKGARLYCRSNVAFNNFFDQIFGEVVTFRQVTKVKPGGEKYEGLQVTMKMADGTEYADNGQEEGDEYE